MIEKVEAEAIDETVLKSVINPEKVKRKIHLLRLEAGGELSNTIGILVLGSTGSDIKILL